MSGRDPSVDDKLDRLLSGGDLSPGEKDHLLEGVLARVAEGDAAHALMEQDAHAQRWWLKMLPLGGLVGAAAAALLIFPVVDDDGFAARGGQGPAAEVSASCGDVVFSGGDQGTGALACVRGEELKLALSTDKASAEIDVEHVVAALLIRPSTLLWFSPDDAGDRWTPDGTSQTAARAFVLPADLPLGAGWIYLWRSPSPLGREDVRPYLAEEAERAPHAPPTSADLAGGLQPATIAVSIVAASSPTDDAALQGADAAPGSAASDSNPAGSDAGPGADDSDGALDEAQR